MKKNLEKIDKLFDLLHLIFVWSVNILLKQNFSTISIENYISIDQWINNKKKERKV